jgi:endonuclease/exonuclease/phosphatase family metal-dependent hydrolase
MRLLTYNIAGNHGRDKTKHLQDVADLIKTTHLDIVGLQEVVHYRSGAKGPDEILADRAGMHAYFEPAHSFEHYCIGNAVLTREPIEETVTHELPHSWPERRILLEVRTCVEGLPVVLFCTHLVHMARFGRRLRLAQTTAISKIMSACWKPHILVGDLNAEPHSRELHPIREVCIPSGHHEELNTWPARRPMILYDHIWPGQGWVVEDIKVLDLHVSDHRPLYAQLGWAGARGYNIMPDEPYLHAGTGGAAVATTLAGSGAPLG